MGRIIQPVPVHATMAIAFTFGFPPPDARGNPTFVFDTKEMGERYREMCQLDQWDETKAEELDGLTFKFPDAVQGITLSFLQGLLGKTLDRHGPQETMRRCQFGIPSAVGALWFHPVYNQFFGLDT